MTLPYHRNHKLPQRKIVSKEITYSRYSLKGMDLKDPDPVGYQKQIFKPSTVSKVIDLPKRVNEGFKSVEEISASKIQRGIILHTDRYSRSSKESLKTQIERLAAEEDYIRKAKFLKRLSERRLKSRDQKLVLEGENVMPVFLKEDRYEKIKSSDRRKQLQSQLDEMYGLKPPPTSANAISFVEDHESSDAVLPVSMEVHTLKLQSRRGYSSEELPDEPAPRPKPNLDSSFFDKLPPLHNPNNGESGFNFESAFNQSERFGPNQKVRIDRYIMDGVPVKFTERCDIQSELKYLKSLILPKVAKDLYVGRGIHLPMKHSTNKANESASKPSTIEKKAFQLETPGGGSITINSTTPTSELPQIDRPINDQVNTNQTMDQSNNQELNESRNQELDQPISQELDNSHQDVSANNPEQNSDSVFITDENQSVPQPNIDDNNDP